MKIIGITGGIGSGKSQVLTFLQERYLASVCQADHVAWELQKPGETCYEEIVSCFGKDVLNPDHTINRSALGQIVFSDSKKLAILNAIMHPAVKARICEIIEVERLKDTPLFVIEAALLLEEHYDDVCDEVWFIYADASVRKQRLKDGRSYTDEKTESIMKRQLSDEVFRERCDVVIDNSGIFSDTCMQIEQAMKR